MIKSNYNVIMKVPIIVIGNSKGLRLPKSLLKQCGFENEVELTVKNESLIITPVSKTRQGWDEAFQQMAKYGDDGLLDPDLLTEFDQDEWEW